ncbi:tobamovirus multiplication protein 1-like [Ipomoea triloba]|uniref:tobamovirus multiplication protein 1-like n=1 Tax=Ipomoea triloba TaxID=35885 RepID=UPI00125D8464|nr:tobamovirus multiplication protein 1-like [Ipomoea triloba]
MSRMLQKFIAAAGGGEWWLPAINLWDKVKNSVGLQDVMFYSLCAAYSAVATVALVQIIRREIRAAELGITTQKLFHVMNLFVSAIRAIVFGFQKKLFHGLPYKVFTSVLLDLPGLLFFSTYTLLVLFWAELYYQARNFPTGKLRFFYSSINAAIYTVQASFWVYLGITDVRNGVVDVILKMFTAAVFCTGALGFLIYGGRLYVILKWYPLEFRGKRRKTREIGCVTVICFSCFLVRCFMVAASGFNKNVAVDDVNHPVLSWVYYMTAEIVPSALVLYIQRRLPPRRLPADQIPLYQTTGDN